LPLIAVFILSISVLIATYCCFLSLYLCLDERKKRAISGNQDRNRENENSNKWQSRQK
jgi:hypothetical protein